MAPALHQSAHLWRTSTTHGGTTILEQQLLTHSTSGNLLQPAVLTKAIPDGHENQKPHFFRLPAELRNVIYEDVLGDLGNAFTCFGGLTYVQPCRVGLLFVNRQIYDETHLLPYALNSITAGPRSEFQDWLRQRTREQLHALSRIHFVFDSFFYDASEELYEAAPDFGYVLANNLAMNSLLSQQLSFRKLFGLKHILVELRSHAVSLYDLIEQIEILQEAGVAIKQLNPQTNVTVELNCLGDNLRQADIPASSTTGLRILRFDRLCEGEGHSIQDILGRRGFSQSVIHDFRGARGVIRREWEEYIRTVQELEEITESTMQGNVD